MGVGTTGAPDVLLCGYYGEDNLGDDALLQVLLQELPEGVKPLITARDAAAVRSPGPDGVDREPSFPPVRAGEHRNGACPRFGGGSLLQDSTSVRSLVYYLVLIVVARLQGRVVILWGQGLGPLRRPLSRLMVRLVLPFCSGASWRDASLAGAGTAGRPHCRCRWLLILSGSCRVSNGGGGGSMVVSWRPTSVLNDDDWIALAPGPGDPGP